MLKITARRVPKGYRSPAHYEAVLEGEGLAFGSHFRSTGPTAAEAKETCEKYVVATLNEQSVPYVLAIGRRLALMWSQNGMWSYRIIDIAATESDGACSGTMAAPTRKLVPVFGASAWDERESCERALRRDLADALDDETIILDPDDQRKWLDHKSQRRRIEATATRLGIEWHMAQQVEGDLLCHEFNPELCQPDGRTITTDADGCRRCSYHTQGAKT